MSETKPIKAKEPKVSLVGLDNLIEDLFGLNAKAFKSVWMSFQKPALYADAARDPHWRGAFTPSVRVWIGLVAFYSALRFFFGGDPCTDGGIRGIRDYVLSRLFRPRFL